MSKRADVAQLEETLCHLLKRRHAIFTGRAATGLFLACRALETLKAHHKYQHSTALRGKVIMPAICCPSPATVSLYADLDPVFCDINADTFNLCPNALDRLLTAHPETVAVLAVHLYGQPASIQKLSAIAQHHGVALIEDVAQALGGTVDGQPLGSFGTVSVVSFGHTKQLDVGWGGAVLTDSDDLVEVMRDQLALLPVRPEDIDLQFAQYRRMVYLLLKRRQQDPEIDELFLLLPENFRQMHLFQTSSSSVELISQGLDNLPDSVQQRRNVSQQYRENLVHPLVKHVELDSGASPWRHTLRIPTNFQGPVTEALRSADIDASNWYPSLHRWYRTGRQQPPAELMEALQHEKEVLNLWVTPDVSMNRMERTCGIILDTLDRK